MTRPELVTDRLVLRPMRTEHLPLLVELDSDPEVLRFILGRARTAAEATAFWGPKAADETADRVGLGWWVGYLRGDGAVDGAGQQFVGWWVLSPHRPGQAEIGWRLRRDVWRRGLATEGAQTLLAYGFERVGLRRVWAETMAVNAASRGVMTKVGLVHERTEVREWDDPLPGSDQGEVTYAITAETFRSRRSTTAGRSPG